MIKLDYSITSPEERNKLVKQILDNLEEEPNEKFLEILADYLVLCMEKQEKKQKKILTNNRMATINKRETSFEGLAEQLENGEDGVYGLIKEDKNILFQPKKTITKKDVEEIPFLKQIRDAIQQWKNKLATAFGRDAYIIKRAIIDLQQDQYTVRAAYRKPVVINTGFTTSFPVPLNEKISFNEKGFVVPEGVSLCNPNICSIILCNYSRLKEEGYGHFDGDLWYLMETFDEICNEALKDYPMYERIAEYKIDGLTNQQIQIKIQEEFGIAYAPEYLSNLWRRKIPNLIASKAEEQVIDNYYLNVERGKYKKCTRCGQIKLAHNKYFSFNKTSKDGFYSICKDCRNNKKKK